MYREIYYHNYCEEETGRSMKLSILRRDYLGEASQVQAGPIPFVKSKLDGNTDLIGGIYPTMAKIQLIGSEDFGMEELFTADDSEFKVEHYISGAIDWVGFMVPESFGEQDTDNLRFLNIIAFDGLTRLKDLKFVDALGQNYGVSSGEFNRSLLFAVKESLKKTGVELDILTMVDRLPLMDQPVFQNYVVNSLESGWVFSTGFNSLPETLLVPGNYITYGFPFEPRSGIFTSEIIEVDRSAVPVGGGVGILLNPKARPELALQIQAYFFQASVDVSEDALVITEHDTRVWIDPDSNVNREDKRDADKPYFEFTSGTWTCWDVLENIAKCFDFQISQSLGKWLVQAVDINRISEDYFRYSYDGVFIDRIAPIPDIDIPICGDTQFYSEDGNTRSFDKTLKSTEVQYVYRLKVKGDPLENILPNGSFAFPAGIVSNPSTFTPQSWTRDNGGITFNINRPLSGPLDTPYIDISTPNDRFNPNSRLTSSIIPAVSGDAFEMAWDQSILETTSATGGRFYVVLCIRYRTLSGETYYLVNSEDESGWTNTQRMSGNPIGQWLRSETKPYFFLSDYSTSHNPTPGGNFSAMSRVNLTVPDVPGNGEMTVALNGTAWAPNNDQGEDLVAAYVQDQQLIDGKVTYIENNDRNLSFNVIWAKRGFELRSRVGRMSIGRIPSGSEGLGRVYNYTQGGNYFDTLNPVNIVLGDEDTTDHLSKLRVSERAAYRWTSRDGVLQVGAIGQVLSRSLMRRYYRPKRKIDGGFAFHPQDIGTIIKFESLPEQDWIMGAGDISLKDRRLTGTLVQLPNTDIPPGGVDYGPDSLKRSGGAGSSGGSSGGGGGGGGNFPVPQDRDLQQVTNTGSTTTWAISTKGTRNALLLAVPKTPVLPDDIISGEVYFHVEDGYVYLDGQKAKAGDSDLWDGKTYSETFDQEVKTVSDVEFASTESGSFKVSSIQTAPASPTSPGVAGEIRFTSTHIYFCVAADTWLRTELVTW